MMGIMIAICKIIEKNRDIIMRVLNFYVQEINFYFKRFLPCLCSCTEMTDAIILFPSRCGLDWAYASINV